MVAKLFSKTGALAGSEFIIEQEAVVGRDASCDISLFIHTISNRHARIYLGEDGRSFFLEDLDSSNGTYLDKSIVHLPTRLGSLHVITFAQNVDMLFQVFPDIKAATQGKRSYEKSDPKHQTHIQDDFAIPAGGLSGIQRTPSRADASATSYREGFAPLPEIPDHDDTVLKTPSELEVGSINASAGRGETSSVPIRKFAIVINNLQETDREVELREGTSVVGRGEVCSIQVRDEYLSGQHAEIYVTSGKVFLRDLNSTNGTFIGDNQLSGETELKPGMDFRLGPTTKIKLTEI